MISAPEDYGMTAEQTLGHRTEALPSEEHEAFWAVVREAVCALPRHFHGAIDAPVNQVLLRSLDDVQIVGELRRPEGVPRAIVVTTHGYVVSDEPGDEIDAWTERGLAVLRLRVRGFPPSIAELGELGAGWILHGIESAESWVMRGAVVDVVLGCRAARAQLPGLPLMLHGESFGGGLAVIAAAQLAALDEPPDRLAVSLPSLGDWTWRLGRYCNGSGGLVNMLLESLRDEHDPVLRSLRLFDAAVHATSVRCPALARLAHLDDTVPAPAAAAVVNALAGRPVWRFVTRYGHFDGGIADARRQIGFQRLIPDFFDPALEPDEFGRRHASEFDLQTTVK
ncbi:MAG: acetylxylan esterase [Planctomycetota bacterium]